MTFMRTTTLAVILAFAGTVTQADVRVGGAAQVMPSTMNITAQGTATASPDQAIIRLGVENIGPSARVAMAANTADMRAVYDGLEKLGIAKEDISTSGLSLSPRYDHNTTKEPRIVGYQVSNQIAVTVRDIDGLGAALDALVSAGANQIQSVVFGIADTSDLERDARIKAAKAARDKADAYAGALGTEILGIMSVSETGGPTPRPYEMTQMRTMAMDSGGPVPVSASDIDVSVTLNVVFELSGSLH